MASKKSSSMRPFTVAWSRGDIDAAWFWEPNLNKVVNDGGEILIHSGTMAKRGYPTWDIGIVMNDFAEKYPDIVLEVIEGECKGIDFWLNNPEETAKIIAEELSLSLDDATRMMKGTEMVPCDEQLTAQYIGTPENKGEFVDTMMATSQFLVEQKRLPQVLPRSAFEDFLAPEYLQKVIE